MRDSLLRICELQPAYTSQNSPEMIERGQLIRQTLPKQIQAYLPALTAHFGEFASEIGVEGSDGIGRKTEAPWVRLFSHQWSPNPRTGFYIVIHFASDGSAVFLTIGCGSTVWQNGDLTPVSDEELNRRITWGKQIILDRWGTTAPFEDEIRLGAKAPLPRTFEKATAVAKRFGVDQLDGAAFERALALAAERLAEIYRCQKQGRDVEPGETAAQDIEAIAKPLKVRGGQGFSLTAPERRAVEQRAMELAENWLRAHGFEPTDTSKNKPYDFEAVRGSERLMVEVKGTTSDVCTSIMMTKGEVELHRTNKGATALIIVSRIRLDRTASSPIASGGTLEAMLAWDIDAWTSEPIAFQLKR